MNGHFPLQAITWLPCAVVALLAGTFIIPGCKADSALYADLVLVKKAERKMYLLADDKVVREYDIALGDNPQGHKQKEGDERTPEGIYTLDKKKADSAYYKAIRISYPAEQDRIAAQRAGVSPGGQIMIHGQKNGFGWLADKTQRYDWTDGCIAITDPEMDEVWSLVDVGTPIVIQP
ncbi:MAG: L,D-transpeptidase family protein [Pseudomonadales bacterium]